MTTTFVIVQHGAKEQHAGDPGITATGHRQATATAQHLAASAPAAIYCGPLRRAVETAADIGARLGLMVVPDPALTERMNWTADSGMTVEEFLADWRRSTDDRDYHPSCGDSSNEAGKRFEAALLSYAGRHPDATVVCVTHGGVTTDFIRTVIGDIALRAMAPGVLDAGVPGGALTTLRRENAVWLVDGVATTDHIPPLDRTG